MIADLLKKINNLGIRYKLFLTYLLVVTIAFCLFLSINFYFTGRENEKQTLYSLQQVMSQTKSFLEFKVKSVNSVLDVLALNSKVHEIVMKDADVYNDNVGFWIGDDNDIAKTIYNNSHNNPEITHLRLYMKSGLAATADTDDYKLLGSIDGKQWYRKFISSGNTIWWYPGSSFERIADSDVISAIRKIPSDQDINKSVGIIRADVSKDTIRKTLEQSQFTKSTSAFLINSDRDMICNSGIDGLKNDREFFNTLVTLSNIVGENTWRTEIYNNEKYIFAAQNIQYTDWKLILAVPYKDVLESSVKARRQMLLIFLCIVPLTLPFSFFVSGSSTKRIRKLIFNMKKAEKGDFDIAILPSSEDEIGQLTKSFNHMLTRIAMLVEDQFKLGHEIKNAEMKALQAQINPHFLYNTLDLINWMAFQYKAPEISTLVGELSKFYKLSLSKGEDVISIEDELKHVKSYVFIQNMRFSNSIQLEINVKEELYEYGILKIILQPLVENAILHGILEKDEEAGVIRITGKLDGNDIVFTVEDDGVGMSEEMLQEVPNTVTTKESHGYGIRNINDRIKLNYGSEYGMTYSSVPGQGTTVTIRIPAIRTNKR